MQQIVFETKKKTSKCNYLTEYLWNNQKAEPCFSCSFKMTEFFKRCSFRSKNQLPITSMDLANKQERPKQMKFWLPNNCSILNYFFSAFSVLIMYVMNSCSPRPLFTDGFCLWENILDFFLLEFQLLKQKKKKKPPRHLFFIFLKL